MIVLRVCASVSEVGGHSDCAEGVGVVTVLRLWVGVSVLRVWARVRLC